MRKIILTAEISSMRREVISAMVNNVLVEVYDGGSIEQVCQEERKK